MLTIRRRRWALFLPAVVLALSTAACSGGQDRPPGAEVKPSSTRVVQETAAVRVDGPALGTYRGLETTDEAVGEQAPDLVGEDFDGDAVTLGADGGQKKLVVFLAHWMSFSDRAAGTFGSWLADADVPSNVSLYAVSSYVRPSGLNYPPSQWWDSNVSAESARVRVIVDSSGSQAAKAYGTDQLPFWVFLDPDNTVLARYAGQLSDSELTALVGSLANGDEITVPSHGWAGATPTGGPEPTATSEPVPAPTRTSEPVPAPTRSNAPAFRLTADYLMSMIGRELTEQDLQQLSQMCYRDYEFRQDIHCEEKQGFGLSLDNATVREVYLYDYYPPNQSSFPAALPGGMRWNSTLASIIDTLGRPECVTSIIGYGLHYTMRGLDVEFSVTANMEPTADLNKILLRPAADRPASCHPYTR